MAFSAIFALLHMFSFILVARCLYSWVDQNPFRPNPVKTVLFRLTEPVLAPIRRYMPPYQMMDLSPIVAIVLIQIIAAVLSQIASPY